LVGELLCIPEVLSYLDLLVSGFRSEGWCERHDGFEAGIFACSKGEKSQISDDAFPMRAPGLTFPCNQNNCNLKLSGLPSQSRQKGCNVKPWGVFNDNATTGKQALGTAYNPLEPNPFRIYISIKYSCHATTVFFRAPCRISEDECWKNQLLTLR
jgi:hypothetical protein